MDSFKSDRLRTVQLNVCKSEEVEEAVEIIRSSLEDPEKGMWGLVNNVGVLLFGDVEFTSMETYKEAADVNLWSTVRTTKAFFPFIRRAKGPVRWGESPASAASPALPTLWCDLQQVALSSGPQVVPQMSLDFKSEPVLREVVTCTPSCGDRNNNSNNHHD